jgi:uncharacterized repeat protein (TIGR01451 family)
MKSFLAYLRRADRRSRSSRNQQSPVIKQSINRSIFISSCPTSRIAMKSFLASLSKIDDSLSILSHRKIKNFVVSVLLCGGSIGALQLTTAKPSQAEGSKEMTSDVSGYRPWFNSQTGGSNYLGINQKLVANVYVQAGEIINVGSSGIGLNGATIILKAPNGTTYTANGTTGGIINNRTEELAGPYLPVTNTAGYTPYSQTALPGEAGVWQVTFISPGLSAGFVVTNPTEWTRSAYQGNTGLLAWDVTVQNSGGTSIPGRTYITNLAATMGSYYPAVLKTDLYVLTEPGYVYKINTSNLAPLQFNFFSNNKGFTTGGSPTYKSLNTNPTIGTNLFDPNAVDSGTDINNKMFLNNPLTAGLPFSASHPTAISTWLANLPIDPVVSNFTYTRNANGVGGTFTFSANVAGSYSIEIDANNNASYADTTDRIIQGLSLSGSNSYVWDGKNSAGAIVNNALAVSARISTRSGEVHFPIADAESNPNGFVITRLNGAGTGDSTIYWDDTSILKTGATKNLLGVASSPSGAHTWGSTGSSQSGEFGDAVGIDTWTFIRSAYSFTSVLPAPNLGTCPATPYISQGINNTSIKLNSVDLQSGVLTPISASNFAAGVNAIGFNQLDGYIYGMKAGSNNTVMKIDANGVGYELGAITGLPLADYIAGDVDANGILYVKSLVGTSAYGIDVNSASPTYLTLVKTITGLATISGAVPGVQDFAFHPSNSKLYTIQGSTGNVYEISWPAAGASVAATLVNRGKPTNLPIGTYGAVYFASDGSMYGYSNGSAGSNNGAIYRMTNVVGIGLPVATTLTTTAAGVSSNDGARCPLAPPVTAPTSKAKLILVKRITAIKDGITVSPLKDAVGVTISFSGFVDDTTSTRKTDDNNCNWPTATGITGACTNTYTIGATTETAPKVKPGDEIEYTIYYLNAGENKATARVCDRLSPNLTFQPDFDASNVAKGIGFNPGGTGITYLTNLGTDDKGQLTDASVTNCNLPSNAGTEVVAVDVGDATTPLLGSTGAGVPTSSYGYIRFKAVVK